MRYPRSSSRLRRPLLLLVPLLALAACGDDDSTEDIPATLPPATSPATSPAPTTAAPSGTYDLATTPDDVVVSVTVEGGFVPAGVAFVNPPVVLVTGDGRVLTTGPVPAIFPGPLLPNILQQSITPVGLQALIAKADELGLLADVTYDQPQNIADAGTTIVEITVGGTTYRHEAYALGLDTETDPARQALGEFVTATTDLSTTVGAAELGPDEPFAVEDFLIQAQPIDPNEFIGGDVEPTFVPWPADASVNLADASTCAVLPAAEGTPLFADATSLTFFTAADATGAEVTYQVTPVQQLPGRSC